ncbi:MAG: thioredoxin family protein [Anaerolineae bacterium]
MDDEIQSLLPGAPAPDFSLIDILSGRRCTLSAARGTIVLLNFWSIECPWSQQYDAYFVERAAQWAAQGITFWMIASNRTEEPAAVRRRARELGLPCPVLADFDCAAADAFGAQTTPHVFIISPQGTLAYSGAVDDRSFRRREASINYVDAALEALRTGGAPPHAESPPYGCAIVRFIPEE